MKKKANNYRFNRKHQAFDEEMNYFAHASVFGFFFFCKTTPSVIKIIRIGKIHPRKAEKRSIVKRETKSIWIPVILLGLREIT